MWTDIAFGIVLYVFPLGILPLVTRRNPAARGVAILAMFVAPLVAALTFMIASGRFSPFGVLVVYPFAFFPLGFWAALIAALTTPALNYFTSYGRVVVIGTATISGAIIGSVFMFAFVHLGAVIQPPSRPIDVSLYVVCGLSAGSIVGLLAAWLVERMPSVGRAVS
jgi:hypothetical protein